METLSEENYIKTIYHLGLKGSDKVSPTSIAESLGNNPASVIVMLRKLAEKKIISYDKNKGARLTDNGRKKALGIVRNHRLWEVFLREKLGYKWDEVHEIAEQLEHVHQAELADRLDKFLGFPKYDPHGGPIPTSRGEVPDSPKSTLSDIAKGKSCQVVGVRNTKPEFLQYLEKLDIGIGTRIKVVDKIDFDASAVILVGKNKTTVSERFTENIIVGVI